MHSAQGQRENPKELIGESSRANTSRGNKTESSERESASERVSESTSENLWKISQNLWKPLKTSENPLKTLPLRDPLRGRFPSQRLSVLLPLFCCPLNSFRTKEIFAQDQKPRKSPQPRKGKKSQTNHNAERPNNLVYNEQWAMGDTLFCEYFQQDCTCAALRQTHERFENSVSSLWHRYDIAAQHITALSPPPTPWQLSPEKQKRMPEICGNFRVSSAEVAAEVLVMDGIWNFWQSNVRWNSWWQNGPVNFPGKLGLNSATTTSPYSSHWNSPWAKKYLSSSPHSGAIWRVKFPTQRIKECPPEGRSKEFQENHSRDPKCRARHNPEPRSEVRWWNLRWSFGGKCFWRFSAGKEARKSPSKLRRKFATNFAENFANFTLEIAGAYKWAFGTHLIGCTPKGPYSPRGVLDNFWKPLLRTPFQYTTHSTENPSPEPSPEPFLEAPVVVWPLRCAPDLRAPALKTKTENLGNKSVVLVNRKLEFTKTLFSLFLGVFCPRDGFSKTAGRAEGDFLPSGKEFLNDFWQRGVWG